MCVSSVHAGDATTFSAFGAVAALRHDEEGASDGPFVDTDASEVVDEVTLGHGGADGELLLDLSLDDLEFFALFGGEDNHVGDARSGGVNGGNLKESKRLGDVFLCDGGLKAHLGEGF